MKVFLPPINFKLLLLLVVVAWIAIGAPLSNSRPFNFLLVGALIQLAAMKAKSELVLGSKSFLILLALAALLTFGSPYLAEAAATSRVVDLGWGAIGYAVCGLVVGVVRKPAVPNRPAES